MERVRTWLKGLSLRAARAWRHDALPWMRHLAVQVQGGERRLRAMARPLARRGRLAGRHHVLVGGATLRQVLGRLAKRFGLRGWRSGVAVATSALALVLLFSIALGGRQSAPRLMPGGQVPEVIGFYQNSWSHQLQSGMASLQAHHAEINTVLAFWYSVDGNGTLHANAPDPAVTAFVRSHHMRMGVMINNIAGSSGNNAGMLTNPSARARAVSAIASMVRQNGYQDVNIDFELLKISARSGLTAFMGDLRNALPVGVRLSESVFPPLGVSSSINGAYDYAALAKVTNYLVVMLYDHHYNGGPAGPVSPYSWVTANLNWLVRTARIPASKVVLAVGVYGYDWPIGSTSATELPLNAIDQLKTSLGVTAALDPVSLDPYFRYTASDGTGHIVWYQNSQTMLQRLKLAEQYNLHGIAIWALGQGTPAVWNAIHATLGTLS